MPHSLNIDVVDPDQTIEFFLSVSLKKRLDVLMNLVTYRSVVFVYALEIVDDSAIGGFARLRE